MDELNNNQMPKIVIKESKTQPVSGAVCVGSNNQIRVAFIEEKLANNEFGDVEIIQEVSTQIVMTPEIARNIIQVMQDNLAQNNY
ncbi:MAG: hypothetical protein IJJ11_02495 [Methanosphaera sp.]|jgi:hypothetical protein|uniref:hypothetical protein n=1 Tax=Methanosphaera sp. BMS TaxID=1789762 RepID=UPI000DC1DE42|nr:hypothetical protein [Methanosphaera sp. BMS]AWX31920.1 hypothetical protein AW729_01900 [Methanosphaera sp. BMS]MBO7719194.1 hypothetical protein [Methanosphaera sp.]MBQ6443533.1 hypothetical protein [Methanosphaera sp.]